VQLPLPQPFRGRRGGEIPHALSTNIDGLIFQVTQNVGTVRVRHVERTQGSSGYNLRKLVRLWISMLVNVSILPLRLMTLAGMITSALGFLAVIEVVLEHALYKTPTGWSSLMAAMLLLSGTQAFAPGHSRRIRGSNLPGH